MVLNFEIPKLVRELKKIKPKKVLVQLPEGIKQNVSEISEVFDNLKIEVIFSGETAWGGCAIALKEAEALKADLIVHFGHAKFIDLPKKFPGVLYIEVKDELNLEPLLKKSLKEIKNFKTLGLSYSVQHRHDIPKIIKFYENKGKKIILSKKMGLVAYEGHIVGCQYRGLQAIEKQVEGFLIIGNQFHSMGAVMSVEKPVILLDVYNNSVRNMKGLREKILKQRIISIEKLRRARIVGVIIEIKLGQKFGSAKYIINKLKEKGKKPILITMDEMTPDKIMNFYNVDAFIELACPRIAIDDFAKYPKPILTFKEALVALGVKTWEEILEIGIV
ncbi:diphthamide biosynthesis enzyme Dph2 [Candidatus Pacearchaeota archaeon CG10_big_fil_rev_8_21_14_0_10_34_12]|nr:MAG: diphthamide biosynthesis enzyme Dph2 [Candidatus Pacearchaeota archaeon CG10_big_fil_rev_8_21_14_0_10_34_12]